MKMSPFFSIIIPLYNSRDYIERSIQSCISQSFASLEVIVIDDYSQDNSKEIVELFIQKDSRIKLFENLQNLGTFRTRLEGVRYAQGQYCLFLDADDFIDKQTCQTLYQLIQNDQKQTHQYTDIVGFNAQYYPKKIIPIPHIPFNSLTGNVLKQLFVYPKNPSILIWNKAYKTSMLQQIYCDISPCLDLLPNIRMGDDILQSFLVYCYANKSIGINKKFYFYCESQVSITRKQDKHAEKVRIANLKSLLTAISILEKTQMFDKKNSFQEAQDKFIKIIQASICLEKRYSSSIFAYPKACIHSLKYYVKIQTYIRIILYFVSFGKIKL